MAKLIDFEDVEQEFNWYHRFLIWQYKNKVIDNWNAKYKLAVQEGNSTVYINPRYDIWHEGLKKKAVKEGQKQAMKAISEKYKEIMPNEFLVERKGGKNE